MGLKLSVDSLDAIEENLRPLYEEKDGKFVLSVDGYEDPTPTKKALESARRAERAMKQEIDKWKTLGKTPEEISALQEKLEELETLKLESKGDFETLKAQWLEKNQGTITKAQKEAADAKAEVAKLTQEREQDRLNGMIDRAIVAAKGRMGPLRAIVRSLVRIEHEDGQVKFVVQDENGQPRFNLSGPNDGKPMTIPELLADLAQSDEYAGNFEGSGASGSGAKPGNTGNGKPNPLGVKRKSDIGPGREGARKLAAFMDSFTSPEEGQKAYLALPD